MYKGISFCQVDSKYIDIHDNLSQIWGYHE